MDKTLLVGRPHWTNPRCGARRSPDAAAATRPRAARGVALAWGRI